MMKKGKNISSVKPKIRSAYSKPKYSYLNIVSFLLFLFISIYLTVFSNDSFLNKLQEMSLFLPTKSFFINIVRLPGGFLSYLGLFLTQFFIILGWEEHSLSYFYLLFS